MKSSRTLFPLLFLCLSASSVNAFASKKSKSNKRASTNKGFGAPPLTFADVIHSFPHRMPDKDALQECICPCGRINQLYRSCCEPLIQGNVLADTPLRLLQSRYTAFCFRNIAYIIDTTHKSCRDYQADKIAWAKDLNKQGMFDSFEFLALENTVEESETVVSFQVKLRSKETGQETIVMEQSTFAREEETGRWQYASGIVRSQVKGLEDTVLNQ